MRTPLPWDHRRGLRGQGYLLLCHLRRHLRPLRGNLGLVRAALWLDLRHPAGRVGLLRLRPLGAMMHHLPFRQHRRSLNRKSESAFPKRPV
jgi:hypothetical protein